MVQTKRRRRRSISVEGAVPATPAAAAAFEVPTAGVPTYLVASALAAGFATSGFGVTFEVSNSAMSFLLLLCLTGPCSNPRQPPRTLALPTSSLECEWEPLQKLPASMPAERSPSAPG